LEAYLESRRSFLDALVVSGGEPTLQEDLPQLLILARRLGLAVKLDTNGSHPERLASWIRQGLLDFVAVDVKAPWSKYGLLAGTGIDCEQIRESIALVASSGLPHLFRTTFDPTLLDETDRGRIRSMIPAGSRHLFQPCRSRRERLTRA